MDYDKLTEETVKQLKKNGWREDRKINVEEIFHLLKTEGYEKFDYVESLMKNLAGLCFSPNKVRKKEQPYLGDVEFDILGSASGEYDRLSKVNEKACEKCFPIGMVYGQCFVYIGESKKVYMLSGNEMYIIGLDIEDYLNNMLDFGKEPTKI